MRLIDILNSPWSIPSEKLAEIRAIYETHMRGEKIDLAAIEARIGKPLQNEAQGYSVIGNGIAVIPIHGVIAKRANLFMKVSGGASTELAARDFKQALADPAVQQIVLHIDSPGGTVDGTQTLANLVFSSRGQKPITAFADGAMTSAAYWIGAAADQQFIADGTTVVGSIGVIAEHVDYSAADAAAGMKRTVIYSGKYKATGNDAGPLSEADKATIQGQLDYIYSVFVEDVAKFKGTSVEQVLADMADGRVFFGQQAIDAGLVGGVSTFDALIAALDAGVYTASDRAGVAAVSSTTNIQKGESMNLEKLKAEHPDLVAAIEKDAYDKGLSAGVAAELARIRDVEAQALPGHDKLIAELKFDGKTSGPEAAAKVLAAEKTKLTNRAADMRADAGDAGAAPAPTTGTESATDADEGKTEEEKAKAAWDKDSDLRAEFGGNFAAYTSWRKAEASGKARIKSNK